MINYYWRLLTKIMFSLFFLSLVSAYSFGQKREGHIDKERAYEKKERDKEYEEREREEEEKKYKYPIPGKVSEEATHKSMDLHFRLERYEAMKALNMTSSAAGTTLTLANGNLKGSWVEKGPNNQPGRIRYADLWSATNTVYALSDGGSVFKGNIDGTGWTCLNDQLRCTNARYIRVIPNGTGKRIFVAGQNCIYSDDDGVTWSSSTGLDAVLPHGDNVYPLSTTVLNDASNTVVMIALHDWDAYIYRSTDKGMSFTMLRHYIGDGIDFGNFINRFNAWAPYKGSSPAYIVTKDSLLKVTSNSITGAKHNLAVSNRAHITGAMIGTTTYLYIYTNNQLYRSASGGSAGSWVLQSSPYGCDVNGGDCRTPDLWGTFGFSCSPTNQNQLYFGSNDLYTSSDGGANWTQVNHWENYFGNGTTSPLNTLHADIPAIVSVYNSSNQEVQLVCCDQGLYKSTDYCKTFTSITLTGMNTNQGYWIYTRPDNPNYIYYGSQDGGYEIATQDAGGLLTFTETISGDYSHVVSTDGSTVWIVNPGEVFYSPAGNNGALTFPSLGDGYKSNVPWMGTLAAHPTNVTQAYFGGGHLDTLKDGSYLHLLTYSNGSITWVAQPYDFSTNFSGGTDKGVIYAIGISQTNPNYRYVLTNLGYFFYSTNGGANWTPNTTDVLPQGNDSEKTNILISKKSPATVYVCGMGYYNSGVYISTNNGQKFNPMNNGLPNTYVHYLAFNDDESLIYAATEVGPYVYVVNESLWYPMTGGTDQAHTFVEYLSASKTARFVTYGRGIWDFKVESAPAVSVTSPANNTYYAAPATITIKANASETGGTISKVEFYNGTTKLGTSTASPYSYTWGSVAAGTYSLTAKAYDLSNVTTTSSQISITVNTTELPSPWVQGDIGSVGLAGSGTYSSGTFTVKGSGADIWGTADAFHYIYQPISGNVEIIAKVNSITNTDAWAKGGVMIRETLDANSKQVAVVATPTSGMAFQYRVTTGGSSSNTGSTGTAPVWVKLNRTGDVFTVSQSADGVTWTQIGTPVTIAMTANVYVGMALTSHNNSSVCTAAFSNVSVIKNTAPTVSITSPVNNANFISPASVAINANATDSDGTISKVEFYNGTTLLNTDVASPYSYTWSDVAAGNYTLKAIAYDNLNLSTTSSLVNIDVVTQTQTPYGGKVRNIPGKIEAEHYDLGGQGIAYNDGTAGNAGNAFRTDDVDIEASSDAGTGYNIGWTTANEWLEYTVNVQQAGTYKIELRVAATAAGNTMDVEFDGTNVTGAVSLPNTGAWQTFQTVTVNDISLTAGQKVMRVFFITGSVNLNYINVVSSNQSPVVSITAPLNNATFTAPANITISANATDDVSISKVEFYNGASLLNTDVTSPYSYVWNNVSAGSYTLTAKAYDNLSVVTTSAAVNISGGTNAPPVVSITAPLNNATFTAPANITISANATDDVSISKVEFYNGAALLNTDVTAPYSYVWNNVGAGSYTLTAKAYDNLSVVTTSAVVNISVTNAGTCTPPQWTAGNASYTTGTTVKNTVGGVVKKYQCTVAGWCQSTSALYYEPGNGIAWTDCWTDLGTCNARMSAMDEYSTAHHIELYPNPTENNSTITGYSGDYTKINIQVMNGLGEIVLSKEVNSNNGEFNYSMDLSNLTQGIYTIKAYFGETILVRKLVKN